MASSIPRQPPCAWGALEDLAEAAAVEKQVAQIAEQGADVESYENKVRLAPGGSLLICVPAPSRLWSWNPSLPAQLLSHFDGDPRHLKYLFRRDYRLTFLDGL